jgi:hypothetical protein
MTPLANGRALLPAPPSVGFGSGAAVASEVALQPQWVGSGPSLQSDQCAAPHFRVGLGIVARHWARTESQFRVPAHERWHLVAASILLLPESAPQHRRDELRPLSVALQTARDGLLVGAATAMVDADA